MITCNLKAQPKSAGVSVLAAIKKNKGGGSQKSQLWPGLIKYEKSGKRMFGEKSMVRKAGEG
jgi:hypothetical protein